MIESLYFQCYYAYLRRNFDDTKMYYDMLKDELSRSKSRSPLCIEYLYELKKIKTSLVSGTIASSCWVNGDTPVNIKNNYLGQFRGNQDSLVRKIHYEAFDDLKAILLGGEGFRLHNIEHPCGIYGAVDMVYTDKVTRFPLEVKKDEGKHDIIGQIAKYDLHFKLNTHLKIYRRVTPVTICDTYQNNVVSELKSMGVKVLKYRLDDGRVRLSEI